MAQKTPAKTLFIRLSQREPFPRHQKSAIERNLRLFAGDGWCLPEIVYVGISGKWSYLMSYFWCVTHAAPAWPQTRSGGFATPERRLIFDINDLDETLPAPWEWDVKRLVASFVLAARSNGLSDADGRDAAVACARSYRRKMRDFAAMDVLEVWYARLDDSEFLAMLPQDRKAVAMKRIAKATARGSSELVFPKLVEQAGGQARIHDTPPIFSMARHRVPRATWT